MSKLSTLAINLDHFYFFGLMLSLFCQCHPLFSAGATVTEGTSNWPHKIAVITFYETCTLHAFRLVTNSKKLQIIYSGSALSSQASSQALHFETNLTG